jgi:PAS domain S-box-containing protein
MVLGGIVVFRDIGARKRGEQQQAHLAAIVNASHDAIISATPAGIIQSWNSGAERLFGYTAAEVAGKSCALLEPPEGLGQASLVFDKLALELATQQYETRQMKRDGTLLYVSTVLSPILDAAGGLAAASMVVRDITEHTRVVRELENRTRELQSSNEELEQFAHSASHDLQEPLRMVTSYVQLLGERYSGRLDADADEFIGFAVDGAARMKQLLGGLLAYSRVGRGRDFTAVAATEALQWALKNLALALAESGATVTCDVLPQVLADRAQLGELFQNLLGNAIKFRGQRRPEIRIGAERRGKEWVFAVADNGIGLDPRHAESIFVMFRRLHRSSEYPGTGIGLAICRKIVERHGGRIWVDAEPGNGAVFRFTLPAVTTVAVEAVTVAAENDRHADV